MGLGWRWNRTLDRAVCTGPKVSLAVQSLFQKILSRRLPGKFLVAKALFLHSGCSFKFLLRLQRVTHTCGVKVEPGARHHGINTRCELALDKHQVSNWVFLVIGIPVLPSCTLRLCWSSRITSFIPAQESSLRYIVAVVQSPAQVQLFVSHGLQHVRLPCPSPCPVVCPSSCPLNQWCHPTISSSVTPFSSAISLSQHQGLFQWVSCSYQVVKVLELQIHTLVEDFFWGKISFPPYLVKIDWIGSKVMK